MNSDIKELNDIPYLSKNVFDITKIGSFEKEIPIEHQLYDFINSEIEIFKPELIILVERKATATLRLIKSSEKFQLDKRWNWGNMISSSAIEQMPSEFFLNKRILVFDDMMMAGRHIQELFNLLLKITNRKLNTNLLRVAVFGIHKKSSGLKHYKEWNITLPNSWYYRDLQQDNYENIRGNIVRMLQNSGSLLLDTEHIEIRIKFDGHLNKLINALNRNGHTVVFNSSKWQNITVYYEPEKIVFDQNMFPRGTYFKNIVQKCRVVRRSINEFALIPICFPSVPSNYEIINEWKNNSHIVSKLFKPESNFNNASVFYAVGLIAALEVLKQTIKDLSASSFKEATISLPKSSEEDFLTDGYTLNHLNVMYPNINLEGLNDYITDVFNTSWKNGNRVKNAPHKYNITKETDDEELTKASIKLLQAIRRKIDNALYEIFEFEDEYPHPFGLTASEIFDIGRALGIKDEEKISAAFDILIDNAFLVTHVQEKELLIDSEEKFYVRTFEPDGEVISNKIRRFTSQFGLPLGYNE